MEEKKRRETNGNLNCKIYSKLEKSSDICLVDIPKSRSYNSFSYVQTLMFLNKQSAIKSSSFECLFNNFFALGIKEVYSSSGTKVILLNTRVQNVLNLFSESLDFDNISPLCSLNSSLSFKGANIFSLLSNKSLRISPPEISILNKTLESITIFIYIKPLFLKFLCIDNLTFSDSSFASSSVNLLLDIISSAIANSSLLTNSFTTLARANSNSLLNSGDTSSLIVISSMNLDRERPYKKLSIAMPKEVLKWEMR